MDNRKITRTVYVGNVPVGGGNPVVVQSMNNTKTSDVKATLEQIRRLHEAGCDITRVAIPDLEAAEAMKQISKESPIPVVADIHFDYRLALEAARNGASKIRINPGNIGGVENVKKVADLCKERNIPIRVGVNSGSIDRAILAKYGGKLTEYIDMEFNFSKYHALCKQKMLDAKMDMTTIMPVKFVIDNPTVADKKYFPKKSLIIVISTLCAFILTMIVLLMIEKIENQSVRKDSAAEGLDQ